MPIIKSAIKRSKQANKRRERNIETKRDVKNATKAFLATPSAETLAKAQGELDTAVKKGLLKKNTAARRKMRLSRVAKEQGVKLAGTKPVTKKTPTTKTTDVKKASVKAVETKAPAKTPAKKPATKTASKTPTKKTTKK